MNRGWKQWSSQLSWCQNPLQGLLKHGLLNPMPGFPTWRGWGEAPNAHFWQVSRCYCCCWSGGLCLRISGLEEIQQWMFKVGCKCSFTSGLGTMVLFSLDISNDFNSFKMYWKYVLDFEISCLHVKHELPCLNPHLIINMASKVGPGNHVDFSF